MKKNKLELLIENKLLKEELKKKKMKDKIFQISISTFLIFSKIEEVAKLFGLDLEKFFEKEKIETFQFIFEVLKDLF